MYEIYEQAKKHERFTTKIKILTGKTFTKNRKPTKQTQNIDREIQKSK